MIISAKTKDEKVIISHLGRIDLVRERVNWLKKNATNSGWTDKKGMKLIASVHPLDMVKHPEWKNDSNEFLRWLRTDYGRQFKVSDP